VFGRSNNHPINKGSLDFHKFRPGFFLGNFDSVRFLDIVQKRIERSSIDLEGSDPLSEWYDLIMDSLQAEAYL